MSEDTPTTQPDHPLFSWSASEYIDHRQGVGWYSLLALATVALAVGAFFVLDYFAVATVILLGLIVGIFAARTPEQLTYQLSDEGLKVGSKFHRYNSFKSFTIVKEGAMTSINFYPIKRLMPPLSIFFDPVDESKIMTILGERLPHEERSQDRVEAFSRRLRF